MELTQSNVILLCILGLAITLIIVLYIHTRGTAKKEKELEASIAAETWKQILEDEQKEIDAEFQPLMKPSYFEEKKEEVGPIETVLQPDLTEISKNWEPFAAIEKIGNFEIYSPTADEFKWRLFDATGNIILTSKASYISETTCRHGITSVKKIKMDLEQFKIIREHSEYSIVCKAKNGKIIGISELYLEEAVAHTVLDSILSQI